MRLRATIATSYALNLFSSSFLEPGYILSPRVSLFKPVVFTIVASWIPHSRSLALILSTKSFSEPAIFSASAIAALFALDTIVASNSCSTV